MGSVRNILREWSARDVFRHANIKGSHKMRDDNVTTATGIKLGVAEMMAAVDRVNQLHVIREANPKNFAGLLLMNFAVKL